MTPNKFGSMTTDMEKKDRERQRKENKRKKRKWRNDPIENVFRMLQRTIAVLAKHGENGNGTILNVVGVLNVKEAEGRG